MMTEPNPFMPMPEIMEMHPYPPQMGDNDVMSGDPVTVGELDRRLTSMHRSIQDSLRAIDERISDKLVERGYYEARHQALREAIDTRYQSLSGRIHEMEDEQRDRVTFNRAIVVALITVFLTAITTLALTLAHIH